MGLVRMPLRTNASHSVYGRHANRLAERLNGFRSVFFYSDRVQEVVRPNMGAPTYPRMSRILPLSFILLL